jgi:Tfp pilus assembly protein PilO
MAEIKSMFRQKLIAEAYLENSKLQLKELKENVIVLIGLIKTGQNAKAYLQMLVVETLLESKPSVSDVSVTPDVLMDIETDQSIEKGE